MAETTTLRVSRVTRDRIARLSQALQVPTADAVVTRALDLLEADVLWTSWESVHAEPAQLDPAATAWERGAAGDWRSDAGS